MGINLADPLQSEDLSKLIYHYYDRYIPAGWSMGKPHQHEAIEIICCLKGSFHMLFIPSNTDVTVNKGDCLIMRPFVSHYLYVPDTSVCRCSCIQMKMDDIRTDKIGEGNTPGIYSILDYSLYKNGEYHKMVDSEAIADVLKRILFEINHKYIYWDVLLKTELLELFVRISRNIERQQKALADGENRYIIKAMEYIKQSLQDEIKPGDIADKLHVSVGYLMHLFKRYTQKSIMAVVTELRIEQSRNLLTNTDLSITDVAFECGYASLQHFSMVFKKMSGMPPSVYRSMIRDVGHLRQT